MILVPEKTLPHTFLNTIFINETEYNNREIEAELYTHELTHVTQNTRWIFYSSNYWKPFLVQPYFFLQKSIQLNHEFLADEKVVNSITMFRFINLYCSKGKREPNFYLASNLNYLITKNDYSWWQNTSNSKSIAKKLFWFRFMDYKYYCIQTIKTS
jgi:hypothetical protein